VQEKQPERTVILPRQTASRANTVPVQRVGDFQPGDILDGRYRIVEVLGRGSNGVTYKAVAVDAQEGSPPVAVKALNLRGQGFDWKQLQLFEREAKALESLSHSGIPRYIDYFEVDTTEDRGFFLVQELAEGKSLAALVDGGWRGSEDDVKAIAVQLLETLEYLASRRPPITHRDIKPENVVIEGGKPGGRVFLVDFGGVQAAAATEGRGIGTTMVGTSGYMAPEQFRGWAQPASDLYGLGGTLLFLLSGRRPYEFEARGLHLEWPDDLIGDGALAAVVEGLLEPLVEHRLSCGDALRLLRSQGSPASVRQSSRSRPADGLLKGQPVGSRVRVKKGNRTLEIDIPPKGVTGDAAYSGGFALFWNAFVAVWTVSALAGGGILMGLFSIPFWAAGYGMARDVLWRTLVREKLQLDGRHWTLQRQMAVFRKGSADWASPRTQTIEGNVWDISGARVVDQREYNDDNPQSKVELVEGVNKHALGETLDVVEQQWLVSQINEHLEHVRGSTIDIPITVERVKISRPGQSMSRTNGGRLWIGEPEDMLDDDF